MRLRMVDRIVAWEPRRMIRGVKGVSFEEYGLKSRFGEEPHLPETLVLESLFQLGNWLIVLSSEFSQMSLVLRTGPVNFLRPLRPGESMVMEAEVRRYRDDGVLFDGRATAGGELIVEGRGCLAAPVALAEYCNPDDLRVLFSEIYAPG